MATALIRRRIGVVSVESGRLLIVDPVYLRHWKPGEYRPDEPAIHNSYDEACKLTRSEPWHGAMFDEAAVVLAPPDGDGIYPVYGYFTEDGLCARLDITLSLEAADWQDLLGWSFGNVSTVFSEQSVPADVEPGVEPYLSGATGIDR